MEINSTPNIPDSIIIKNYDWQGFGYLLYFMFLKNLTDIDIVKTGIYYFEHKMGDVKFSEECFFETYPEAKSYLDQEKDRLSQEYGKNIQFLDSQSYIYYSPNYNSNH